MKQKPSKRSAAKTDAATSERDIAIAASLSRGESMESLARAHQLAHDSLADIEAQALPDLGELQSTNLSLHIQRMLAEQRTLVEDANLEYHLAATSRDKHRALQYREHLFKEYWNLLSSFQLIPPKQHIWNMKDLALTLLEVLEEANVSHDVMLKLGAKLRSSHDVSPLLYNIYMSLLDERDA